MTSDSAEEISSSPAARQARGVGKLMYGNAAWTVRDNLGRSVAID